MSDVGNGPLEVSVGDVVSYLRIEGGFSEALASVVRRTLLLRAADEAGVSATTDELQRVADAYRAINGLHKASDTVAWMRARITAAWPRSGVSRRGVGRGLTMRLPG